MNVIIIIIIIIMQEIKDILDAIEDVEFKSIFTKRYTFRFTCFFQF